MSVFIHILRSHLKQRLRIDIEDPNVWNIGVYSGLSIIVRNLWYISDSHPVFFFTNVQYLKQRLRIAFARLEKILDKRPQLILTGGQLLFGFKSSKSQRFEMENQADRMSVRRVHKGFQRGIHHFPPFKALSHPILSTVPRLFNSKVWTFGDGPFRRSPRTFRRKGRWRRGGFRSPERIKPRAPRNGCARRPFPRPFRRPLFSNIWKSTKCERVRVQEV